MRLYYHPKSTCSRRVLMAVHHLNINIDLAPVDLLKGEQNSPEFLKLNPNHSVPVLEDGDFVLWESYAIMQYLADITPGQTLYLIAPRPRADVNRWLFWCGEHFMPGFRILNWENSIKSLVGMGLPDPVEVARGESLLKEAAKILDAHLGDQEWICPVGLSIADLAIAAALAAHRRAKLPIADRRNLQRWFRRVQALEFWKKMEADGNGEDGANEL